MYSIGVDIGTSTTEVIISQLDIVTRPSASLLQETILESAKVIYQSEISDTPLLEGNQINFTQIREIVHRAVKESGIKKEQIETGAVIITGETARKDNAKEVSNNLSEYLGDFVVATAGPKLEAILAGHGAGMCQESNLRKKRILNLDIGGGTLNAVVFDAGERKECFAMDIGGRLLKFDRSGYLLYISERIQFINQKLGHKMEIGKRPERKMIHAVCQYLVQACLEACGLEEIQEETKRLYITEYILPKQIDFFSVSGGVGEYFNGKKKEQDYFGDIGAELGTLLKKAFEPYKERILQPKESIRATVIGAGCHAVSVSGSTIGIETSLLPLKDVPIIKTNTKPQNWDSFARDTKLLLDLYENDLFALAIQGKKSPSYQSLKILTKEIETLYQHKKGPVILLLQEDFAKALSQMLHVHTQIKNPVICLDQLKLENGDYIDIGQPVGSAVPIVLKTLIYQS